MNEDSGPNFADYSSVKRPNRPMPSYRPTNQGQHADLGARQSYQAQPYQMRKTNPYRSQNYMSG